MIGVSIHLWTDQRPRDRLADRADAQHGLQLVEDGGEGGGAVALVPKDLHPAPEDRVGGSEADGGVDERAPADAAAGGDGHRRGPLCHHAAALLHVVAHGVTEVGPEAGLGRPLLQDDDGQPRGGELSCGGGAARPGTDDDDVGLEVPSRPDIVEAEGRRRRVERQAQAPYLQPYIGPK